MPVPLLRIGYPEYNLSSSVEPVFRHYAQAELQLHYNASYQRKQIANIGQMGKAATGIFVERFLGKIGVSRTGRALYNAADNLMGYQN